MRRGTGDHRRDHPPVAAHRLAAEPTDRVHDGRPPRRLGGRVDTYLINYGPVWYAADWFASIAWTTFLEIQDTHSKPRGLRMLDGRPTRTVRPPAHDSR